MSNPFYIYSGAFIPGILARAEAETAEFQAVQQGFALLAIQGVDTGAANAYVVATAGGQNGAYKDGMIVEFKAVNANTGSCTIAVDSGATVSVVQPSGASLAGGAIAANSWIRLVYNTTYSAFTLVAPTSLVTTSNTISASAPTNKVGLTAAGGVSTACVPIDATYAIDQSIAPTWTGAHTFSNTVSFASTVSFTGGLVLTGLAGQFAITLDGSSTTGQSYGLSVNAGSNASDVCATFFNKTGGTQYLEILGEGSVTVGSPTGGGQGIGTINATGLFINGVAVATAVGANPTASVGLAAVNGSAVTFLRSDGAPALSQAISPTWTAAHTFTPSSGVAITINIPVNNHGLVIVGGTNTINNYMMTLQSGSGSGFSSGLAISAGTNSSDAALLVRNAATSANFFSILGDGTGNLGVSSSLNIGWSATVALNANQTNGSIGSEDVSTTGVGWQIRPSSGKDGFLNFTENAVADRWSIGILHSLAPLFFSVGASASGATIFQLNGTTAPTIQGYGPTAAALVDMTPDKGTFTITYTDGSSGTASGTAVWSRNGNQVTLFFPSGTFSTSTHTLTASSLPAAIRPARTQIVAVPIGGGEDNGSLNVNTTVSVANSATITFLVNANSAGWTNSGVKGVNTAFTLSYLLN